jgi:hypothetical protein
MIDRRYFAALAIAVFTLSVLVRPVQAQQQRVSVPASVLEQYVGEYVYPEGTTLKVTLSGDTLFREDPGRRVPMIPLSETMFRLGGSLTVEFVTHKSYGTTLILGNGTNMEFRLPRKGSRPVPAPTPKAVHVPRSVLERYVGEYEYIRGQMNRTDLRVFIHLREGVLTQKLDTNDERVLIPLSETRFNVSGTALVTEFVIDDAGVTQVMGSGGRVMLARLKPKTEKEIK